MQLFDPNNPNEKKKMIAAAALGVAALITLGYLFLGGSSKPAPSAGARPTPTPRRPPTGPPPEDAVTEDLTAFREINYSGTAAGAPDSGRNIFSYYEPPPPPVKQLPTPTPAPPPPLTVSSVSPATVYARTGDFSLQVGGDKFTPAVRIIIDGRAVPTRYINAQQLGTTVTADMIANPGNRRIEVKTPDGALYSNVASLNVTPPPVPNYTYVGLIGKPRGNDIAVLQDKGSKDLLNAQRGDTIGGRFRITSISDKEILLIDTNLKISHKMPFSPDTSTSGRPPTRRAVVDDDPQE
jgi:hypothetical protein